MYSKKENPIINFIINMKKEKENYNKCNKIIFDRKTRPNKVSRFNLNILFFLPCNPPSLLPLYGGGLTYTIFLSWPDTFLEFHCITPT